MKKIFEYDSNQLLELTLAKLESKNYLDAEITASHLIESLKDDSSLTWAYLLRCEIFKQLDKIDLALKDLNIVFSQSFFNLNALNLLLALCKTKNASAENLITHILNYWLYFRPQNYSHPLVLEAIGFLKLPSFGYVAFEKNHLTGWIVTNAIPEISIEIDGKITNHICQTSLENYHQHKTYTFYLNVPEKFYCCRVGIRNGSSLWGSPIVNTPKEFIFSDKKPFDTKFNGVELLIPAYKGFEETQACLHSIYHSIQFNKNLFKITVVNDCSPDKKLTNWLRKEHKTGRIKLIEREFNVGFVGAVNTGLFFISDNDVILLNTDTLVVNNWVDRLQQVALQSNEIGTVTPLSNNAELLSYPISMKSNAMPEITQLKTFDNLLSQLNNSPEVIPTGVGFCLYIRRDLLNKIPFLNEKLIQRGYGEETEFCLKASAQGWKNVVATNVFVAHKGNVSFGNNKVTLARHNVAQIHARFPNHGNEYDTFLRKNPLHRIFRNLQRTWLPNALQLKNKELNIVHERDVENEKNESGIFLTILHSTLPLTVSLIFNNVFGLSFIEYEWQLEIHQLVEDLQKLGITHFKFQYPKNDVDSKMIETLLNKLKSKTHV